MRSINAQIEYLLTDQARRAGRLPKRTVPRPPGESPADGLADPDAPDLLDGDEDRSAAESRR
jgi:hypothetical protein